MIHLRDPTEKQSCSFLLPRHRQKRAQSPITWIPYWLFNTEQHSLSSYLGPGIHSGQTNLSHKRTDCSQVHNRKDLQLPNVNQGRSWACSHVFLARMFLWLPAAWPVHGSLLQKSLMCGLNRCMHHGDRMKMTVNSQLIADKWVCCPQLLCWHVPEITLGTLLLEVKNHIPQVRCLTQWLLPKTYWYREGHFPHSREVPKGHSFTILTLPPAISPRIWNQKRISDRKVLVLSDTFSSAGGHALCTVIFTFSQQEKFSVALQQWFKAVIQIFPNHNHMARKSGLCTERNEINT